MKATGIVRRLDDLGRLVIPKEIRKQYRLNEGDSIEFYIDQDRIIIQKHDILSRHMEEINIMCDTLQAMYQNKVLFIQDGWLQQRQIQLKESFINLCHTHRMRVFENEQIYMVGEERFKGLIYPVISYGDWFGAFVILFDKKALRNEELYAVEAFTQLLSRQQSQ